MKKAQKVLSRYLSAKQVQIDLAWLESLRKDFLTLLKNLPRVKDYKTAHQLREALWVYRNRFEDLFFKRFLDKTLKYEFEIPDSTKDYLDKKIRGPAWQFCSNLTQIPINFSGPYRGEDTLFREYEEEAPKWEVRLRGKSRFFWTEMKDVIGRISYEGKEISVDLPEEELVTLAGFKTLVKGYGRNSWDKECLGILKAGLEIYKRKASATLPWLIKHQLPVEIDFEATLDKAGSYAGKHINFYACTLINETPERAAHIMAHEMGHHMFKSLSGAAQTFWSEAIRGDLGEIDLQELLDKWPNDLWAFEFTKFMAEKDPVLALQVDALSHEGHTKNMDRKEDFQRLLDEGQRTLRVPKTPISGYANKNKEEAFCEAVGLLVAYGPRAVHERVRGWLKIVIPGEIKLAKLAVPRTFLGCLPR